MRRGTTVLLLIAFVVSACSSGPNSPSGEGVPGPSFPTPDPTGGPEPGASAPPDGSGGNGGAQVAMPADIVAAVDRLLGAETDAERTEAASSMLASVGVTISDDEAAEPETNAGVVLDPAEVASMAREAADRTLGRATLADFAEAFGGMALLPPNEALAGELPDDWDDVPPDEAEVETDASAEVQLTLLPSRVATVMSAWVAGAVAAHASTDPDLVALTNAPLLLAELARRRTVPLDLTQSFAADEMRLGSLEITMLIAGIRGMLAGVEASGIASGDAGSIVLAGHVVEPYSASAPTTAPTPCDSLKQMLNSRVPLASTVIKGYVGDQIKGFIQSFVNALFGEASDFAQNVARSFKILGILLKVQALALLYSDSVAKVEMDPAEFHKPDGSASAAGATVTAGIDDAAWEAAKAEREASPFSTALRVCARHIGLPVWQDLIDVGDAIDGWQVGWSIRQGARHVQINAREQFWGPGAVPGRQEKPLSRVNDHSGNDRLSYEVLPERREDHPGTEMREPVQVCAAVYPKAPPSGIGTILSAGTAGASMAGGSYFGLVGVITSLLTAWISTIHGITGCGVATVSFHIPTPGTWHGTVTVNTELQESFSTTSRTYDPGTRITTLGTHSERTSIDVYDRFFVGGDDDPSGMGYAALDGRVYTNGAGTHEEGSSLIDDWSYTCGKFDKVESENSAGGWYFDGEGSVSIGLYPDGTYTLDIHSRAEPGEEIVLPGEHTTEWSASEAGCPAGTDEWNAPMYPTYTSASAPLSRIEGQVDPEDPGNVLRGQDSFTNFDGSVTTVTWNLVHDGPIRLPGG